MTLMNRVRVPWSGWAGQPGVSTFYLGSTTTDMTAIKTFITAIGAFVPAPISMTIPVVGDQINDTDGKIAGAWTGSNGGNVVATGSNTAYAGSAGIVVDWLSSLIVAGRRVQGRTYFVPAASTAYQNDGTIVEATRTTITTAASALIAAYAGEFKVFSRPFPGKDAVVGPPPKPAVPPRVGVAAQVVAARVPDIAAVMRSRRS